MTVVSFFFSRKKGPLCLKKGKKESRKAKLNLGCEYDFLFLFYLHVRFEVFEDSCSQARFG